MNVVCRRTRLLAAAAAAALALTLAGPVHTSGAAVDAAVEAPPVKAGADGPVLVVEDQATFSGFDLATDPSTGVAYLGWISSSAASPLRAVHLCVLPPGALACSGGVLTTSAVDGPSAAGLQVEVTSPGTATLVWYHNFSSNSLGALSFATYAAGVLGAPATVAGQIPPNGQLFDVVPGPGGLWAVAGDGGAGTGLRIIPNIGVNAAQPVTAPWMVGNASLAFQGSQPVLLIAKYGSIGDPLAYASGTPMGSFKSLAKTWTTGQGNDLVGTSHGVRAIASEAKASYRPAVAKWNGSEFSKPELIGENDSCPGLFHDAVTDGSGRIADVVERCGKVIIYNLPGTETAAKASFPTGGTLSSGGAQITTTTRGYGWVAWGTLSPTSVGNRLQVRAVRLPALMIEKSKNANPGKVTGTGPASCLPVVEVKAKVTAKAANGWNVASKKLTLDGDGNDATIKLDGEKLKSGEKYTLLGKAVFKKGGQTATVVQKLKFKVC